MARDDYQHLYNTARWVRRRSAQLRTEPLCRMCKQMGYRTLATVADHIEAHRGDTALFFEGELQSLCSTCHSSVKQAEEKSGAIRGCDAQGNPIDPGHHWSK